LGKTSFIRYWRKRTHTLPCLAVLIVALSLQLSGGCSNWLQQGLTLVDSLDTLHIMGLHDEFKRARDWVASSLNFDNGRGVSLFETVIRILGGLLSAFDFSKDRVFLDKAKDLGDRLLPAFNTPTGLPNAEINLAKCVPCRAVPCGPSAHTSPVSFAAATRRPCRGPAALCSLPKSAPCRSVRFFVNCRR
jgi:hypothetical protein